MAVGLDPAIQSDPTATVNEKSAHETRTCRERERQCMKHRVPVLLECSEFFTTDECQQNLKGGVQSVQDIGARNPGLCRLQLSPPPVAVSIALVW